MDLNGYWYVTTDTFGSLSGEDKLIATMPVRYRTNPALRGYLGGEAPSLYIPKDTELIKGIKTDGEIIKGRREGGRSSTLEKTLFVDNQEFCLNVKGSGAKASRAGAYSVDILSASDKRTALKALKNPNEFCETRMITNLIDRYGRPYGGQRPDWSDDALKLSDGIFSRTLGMYVCPVLAISEVPQKYIVHFKGQRKRRAVSQELRLTPSNVRLRPDTGIAELNHRLLEDLVTKKETKRETFIHNLVKTLTQEEVLSLRTLSYDRTKRRYAAFGYESVAPDKDSAVAKDGRIYFADLEGIKEICFADKQKVADETATELDKTLFRVYFQTRLSTACLNFAEFLEQNKDSIVAGLPREVELKVCSGAGTHRSDTDNPLFRPRLRLYL